MQFTDISENDKNILLETARHSIAYGLEHRQALPIKVENELENYSSLLKSQAATFVTLNKQEQLRGCIGTLKAYQPLVKDVSEHAYAAAFQDPRFPPVTEQELNLLEIHISILTPGEPMSFTSEEDLLKQLQPGIDGLILNDGPHKATFLPSVWEQLKEPKEFLNHLKRKAGLDDDYWSEEMKVFRYKTISIE